MRVASAAELGRTGKGRLAKYLLAAILTALIPFAGGGSVSAAPVPYPTGPGYWLLGGDGGVFAYGDAQFYGSEGGLPLVSPVVDIAPSPFYEGYWGVALDGGVFTHNVPFYGSPAGVPLAAPVLGIAAHPSGLGYWLAASDGGVFSYGASKFHGSLGGIPLNAPIVGIAPTPTGAGYWLVAADGGVFAFGDARFWGSLGGQPINAPIIGIEATPSGKGYVLVALDGGVFTFGDASFHGSPPGFRPEERPSAIVGVALNAKGDGYWMVAPNGAVYAFGNVPYLGGANGVPLNAPILAIAARPPLSLVVDPFVDDPDTGRTSAWVDETGNDRLELTHVTGVAAGARILGVEGLAVSQLLEVGFSLSSGACDGSTPQIAIYADTNGDGNFDATKKIRCSDQPGPVYSVDPTTGAGALPANAVVTGMDVLFAGNGTVRVDDIKAAGITVTSRRIHTVDGPAQYEI